MQFLTASVSKFTSLEIESVEMSFWRRMLRMPWKAKKTNKEIMEEAGQKRSDERQGRLTVSVILCASYSLYLFIFIMPTEETNKDGRF